MLERQFTHSVLRPTDVQPSQESMMVVGTFNPGGAAYGDGVAIVARVAEEVQEQRDRFISSPRYAADGKIEVDWLPKDEMDLSDPRHFSRKDNKALRLRFISYLKIFFSKDGKTIDREGPAIYPEGEYEEYGIEDPRVTQIDGTYYIVYAAVSRYGVCVRLISTTDFEHFHRHGTLFAPDNKDAMLFPEKIFGDYVAIHRPMVFIPFSPPQMWLARSSDLLHWGSHQHLLGGGREGPYQDRIGGGTPPVRTDRGWLTIYHGSDKSPEDTGAGVYSASLLLLDLENPTKILAHTAEPFMTPEADFETKGFVDNVVFPTAMIDRGDQYWVYYGAADEAVGVAGYNKQDVMDLLERQGVGDNQVG